MEIQKPRRPAYEKLEDRGRLLWSFDRESIWLLDGWYWEVNERNEEYVVSWLQPGTTHSYVTSHANTQYVSIPFLVGDIVEFCENTKGVKTGTRGVVAHNPTSSGWGEGGARIHLDGLIVRIKDEQIIPNLHEEEVVFVGRTKPIKYTILLGNGKNVTQYGHDALQVATRYYNNNPSIQVVGVCES